MQAGSEDRVTRTGVPHGSVLGEKVLWRRGSSSMAGAAGGWEPGKPGMLGRPRLAQLFQSVRWQSFHNRNEGTASCEMLSFCLLSRGSLH